ncbi:TolC family protein [Burkholderia cenocepacia]|uniref:TolC family protein n=1 Tax=Burkholderia cenocepacia TaxID=95486 RepID=UPI001BA77A77|nr:TolC family protein [Burkholderia cenocepacia]QUO30527.1 TolC family protein [Burkholderia cenocepacia]
MRGVFLSVLAVALAGVSCADAQMLDVFRTRGDVPVTPAAPLLKDASCGALPGTQPLELDDAILLAICANPQARRAWAEARAQAAALGIADAAYLPTLNATAGVERDTLSTTYDTGVSGAISVSQNTSSKYGTLNLSWVLFDFGKRGAARRQARALLAAANATQDDALQTVFFNAAETFYAVRDAQASLDSARQTEAIAHESLMEATAKHEAGAGTLADELQARTSYRRAVLDRVSAEGDANTATGTLAVALGLEANAAVRIAPREHGMDADASDDIATGIDQLIDEAKQSHPKLVAAHAKLDAARANVDAVRAQGRPTISLVGNLTQNNPSTQQQAQSTPITRSRGSTIGVQVTIPLFEGFASGYRIVQARAQADAQEAGLRDTELQVSLDVWKSYHAVQTDALNLINSRALLDDAQHALEIARGRYREGVGTFTDLLNAQTALADAQKQRVLAVSKWRTARLKLAASLGKLRMRDERM